jgi:2-polyprenyl-3-methyl-5-hydroxy-6-metoxy-1,4-benzoquinol methylase
MTAGSLRTVEPDAGAQQKFWNEWNATYRNADKVAHLDYPTIRRRDTVIGWLRELGLPNPDILDLGCATGWLTVQLATFGSAAGVDIADASVREARARYPHIRFDCGDFARMDSLKGTFDVIVSLDTVSHVPDQRAFLRNAHQALRSGGYLMLTVQNRFVFERRGDVAQQGAGQIRRWVSRKELRDLLTGGFIVRHLTTLVPDGHLGILRFVNSRKLNGALRRLGLLAAADRFREALGLGQTIAVLAQRR